MNGLYHFAEIFTLGSVIDSDKYRPDPLVCKRQCARGLWHNTSVPVKLDKVHIYTVVVATIIRIWKFGAIRHMQSPAYLFH